MIYSVFGEHHKDTEYSNVSVKIYDLNEPVKYEDDCDKMMDSTCSISWNHNRKNNNVFFSGFARRHHQLVNDYDMLNEITKYNKTSIANDYHNNPFFLLKKTPIGNISNHNKVFCAFVVSNCGCKKRNEMFRLLSKYKFVHSFGRCMKNSEEKNILDQKHINKGKHCRCIFLYRQFKFVICFENSSHNGYMTEKLAQAMLARTAIPIYWGNKEVGKIFNTKSFINVHDYDSLDDVVKVVKELDMNNDKYLKMLNEPWVINNEITDEWRVNSGLLSKSDVARELSNYF